MRVKGHLVGICDSSSFVYLKSRCVTACDKAAYCNQQQLEWEWPRNEFTPHNYPSPSSSH